MTEPTPSNEKSAIQAGLPAAPTSSAPEPTAYQPVSGWAIAGLGVSAFYVLLVAISGGVAFYQGAPFFYPDWVLIVPLVGIGLSLFGQRHVATSEGTRTGAKLAVWGFRLSLVAGLVYVSYYFATRYTLQSQANTFVMEMRDDSGFLKRLCKGAEDPDGKELNYAFLLTQPPTTRKALSDNEKSMRQSYDAPGKEGGSGLLTFFRERDTLPRILYKDLGKDAQITPLNVLEWKYEQRSYKIYRTYRIKTKELQADLVLAVFSMEAEAAGQGRKWFVNLRESGLKGLALTDLGERVNYIRQSSREWFGKRIKTLTEGTPFPDAQDLDKTKWDLLVIDTKKVDVEQHKKQIHDFLAGKSEYEVPLSSPTFEIFDANDQSGRQTSQVGKWEQDASGKIRMFPMFKFTLRKGLFKFPIFQYEAVATLETKQSIDPAKFERDTPIDWRLVGLQLTGVNAMLEESKGLGPGQSPK